MTNIVNNQKTEQHLCGTCATELQQEGKLSPYSSFMNDMWDNSFFTNDFFKNMVYPDNLLKSHQSKRCPQCGITYDEFNRVGRFGCGQCYETFNSEIDPLLQRIQGSSEYEGTVPSRGTNVFKAKYEVKRLRHQLDTAVQAEKFEEAAILRDKIKELEAIIDRENIKCPECGSHDYTNIRQFNLMFKTNQGVVENSTSQIYLRPETAQGIFVNFKNVQRSMRKKLPFGIGQIGKSFRNEITPGNFIFRTREFEQMELEFFCEPGTELDWHTTWKNNCEKFLLDLGMTKENIRLRDHDQEELSHYSNATTDIEFKFPFGWGELWGIASRTDYDLKQHMEHSGQDLTYQDLSTNEKFIPYCIEPSVGVDRVLLAFLCDAYNEEEVGENDTRTVLKFHPALAPYKAAILPLSKKLSDKAVEVYQQLAADFMVDFDETGSIGKRYRRQDEVGTPFCITYDFESENDGMVTVRDRDTMEQTRIPITELKQYIEEKIKF